MELAQIGRSACGFSSTGSREDLLHADTVLA